jgi:hypothetical protein
MWKPKLRSLFAGALLFALVFVLGFCCCLFGSRLIGGSFNRGSHRTEEMRVTSPDGQFDAVLVSDYWGGAIGGIEWYLYVVRKGHAAPADPDKAMVWGESMRGEKVAWRQAHLLELQYDHALIVTLRNLWALDMVEGVGSHGEGNYYVEIRLAPTSPDFSLLQPNGEFAH